MKSSKTIDDIKSREVSSVKAPPDKIYCGQKVYPCYPKTLDTKPEIPSSHRTLHGAEVVTAFMKDGKYAFIPVTVENGKTLAYKQDLWGKGRQLTIDAADFPMLAQTGLHSEAELDQNETVFLRKKYSPDAITHLFQTMNRALWIVKNTITRAFYGFETRIWTRTRAASLRSTQPLFR